MNRWALRPTDTFIGRPALIGTSMAMDCFCRTDTFRAPGSLCALRLTPTSHPCCAGTYRRKKLRWMYDRRDVAAWPAKKGRNNPQPTGWVADNIEETLSSFRLPLAHCKPLKATHMLQRFTEE